MREVNGFFLFELGQVALLAAMGANVDLTPKMDILLENEKNFRNFAEAQENKENLPACVDVASDLAKLLKEVIERKPFPSINLAEYRSALYLAMTFRDRLSAGLGRVFSYVLQDKGGRNVETLWKKPLLLLPVHILPHLSDFTTGNIEEAARCWILDRPTATGFHMMRAIECVLRGYSESVTGNKPHTMDKHGNVRWLGFGKIVQTLTIEVDDLKKKKSTFGKLELAIGILRPMCKLFRDPLSHPEIKALNEDEAKIVFNQGLDLVSTMVQDVLDGGLHFKSPPAKTTWSF